MSARLQRLFSRKENVYLALALSCGLVMAAVNPPFIGVPDEQAHYWKAWSVALGEIVCRPDNMIPKSALDISSGGGAPALAEIPGVGKRVVLGATIDKVFEKDSDELAVGGRAVCNAIPIGHLPQALGLRVGRALGLSALGELYLARFANLAASVAVVALAISVIPFGKMVLLVVGLLPMTIQQFASLNYDGLHIGLCFLFIAYALRLSVAPERPAPPGRLAALAALGLLAFNVKFGYVGLALLVFVLPPEAFATRRRYWLSTLGFVAANVLVSWAAYTYLSGTGGDGSPGQPGVNASVQVSQAAASPAQFPLILITTLYVDLHYYLETFLFKPGWLRKSLPPWWYLSLLAGTFLLLRNETETVPLTRRQRFVLLGVFAVNFLVVFFSMYVNWTKVGEGRIEGVQGRYLLGVAPLAILFFYKSGFTFRHRLIGRHLPAIALWFYLAVFGVVFVYTYKIYYDKRPRVPLATQVREKLLGPP